MSDEIILRSDRPYLIRAVAAALTHSQLGTYEDRYDLATEAEGNKENRARVLVSHILDKTTDPTREILDLFDFAFIDHSGLYWPASAEVYQVLEKKVLGPRGITRTDNGFTVSTPLAAPPTASPVAPPAATPPAPEFTPSPTAPASTVFPPVPSDARKVFVVHGRDMRPVTVLNQFLTFVGLRMMTWSEARKETGKTQPTTYEIVETGMQKAAAIVVIFSPDEEARLAADFTGDGNPGPIGTQPRQNVILEAGMAYALSRQKTIFVHSGDVRPISDIDGFNWVKLDGAYDSRQDFKERLVDAGCLVHEGPLNLVDDHAGPFTVK